MRGSSLVQMCPKPRIWLIDATRCCPCCCATAPRVSSCPTVPAVDTAGKPACEICSRRLGKANQTGRAASDEHTTNVSREKSGTRRGTRWHHPSQYSPLGVTRSARCRRSLFLVSACSAACTCCFGRSTHSAHLAGSCICPHPSSPTGGSASSNARSACRRPGVAARQCSATRRQEGAARARCRATSTVPC